MGMISLHPSIGSLLEAVDPVLNEGGASCLGGTWIGYLDLELG